MVDPTALRDAGVRQFRRRRPVEQQSIHVESDLASNQPVTEKELAAIEQLLGPELQALLAD